MKKIYYFVSLLAIVMAACTQEEINIPENNEEMNSIVAEIVQPQSSRLAIGAPVEGDGVTTFPVTWTGINPDIKGDNGDLFVAFDENGKKAVFNFVGETGATVGKFVKFIDSKNVKYYDADFAMDKIKDAVYLGGGLNASNLYKMANSSDVFSKGSISRLNCTNSWMYGVNEGGVLKFYQTTGLLEVNVKGDFKGFQKVTLTWDNQDEGAIAGSSKFLVDGANTKLILKDVKAFNSQGVEITSKKNTISCTMVLDAAGTLEQAKIYFALPVGTYPSTFKIQQEGGSGENKLASPIIRTVKLSASETVTIGKKLYRMSKAVDFRPTTNANSSDWTGGDIYDPEITE